MVASALWSARHEAERALIEELKPFAGLLDETFRAMDDCLARLASLNHPFGRVCALVLTKARNLGLGCYSLSLDALAQEAGALFRPLLECLDLLTYFRLDPSRIDAALDNRLPRAGVIAQRIEGPFKSLRDYLNSHASHLSVSPEAMIHLIDFNSGQLRALQTHNTRVLRQNLSTLLAVLVRVVMEATNCYSVGGENVDDTLADRVEDIKHRAYLLLNEPTRS